ncbi:MAG TPA: low temperature requirement protein A [Kineosporiaceae bacterium]|nr:low temperature requirement protein A [Kineosporiaceae bacterium]
MSHTSPALAPAQSVRTLELFFDLVFVFTITQVTSILATSPTPLGLARTAALLAVTWWMYGGYVWLTNALDLGGTAPRLLLLVGMAAFFIMSLAVPHFFDDGRWGVVLGVSYLVVVIVHSVGFLQTSGRAGIIRIGPLNTISALIVLAAGAGPAGTRLWLLLAAVALEVATPFIVGIAGFAVGAGHFVERHGLALIILLGESIIAIGTAASAQVDLGSVIVGALLALAVSAAMWWLYFDREEAFSERALERIPAARRGRAALFSYGYSYYVLILGITVVAVGLKKAVGSFDAPMHGLTAWMLPAGLALYLIGLAIFHHTLAQGWPLPRLIAAVSMLIPALAGAATGGWLALAAATAVLVLAVVAESARPTE